MRPLPDGSVGVRYRYSAAGDLIEVKQVTQATPVEKSLTSAISYRPDRPHYLAEYIDANGHRAVKTEYDPATGRLKGVTDANGQTATQEFDPANFSETVRDAGGNPTVVTYNARGNVVKSVTATEFGDVVTQYAYDDPRNPDKETKTIDGRGFVTARAFDAAGNLLAETTPDGTTAYTYNAQNRLTRVVDPLGRTTVYEYSSGGNLVRVIDPRGDGATFAYDPLGRVETFTDFAGTVIASAIAPNTILVALIIMMLLLPDLFVLKMRHCSVHLSASSKGDLLSGAPQEDLLRGEPLLRAADKR